MAPKTIQIASFNVENLIHAGAGFARDPEGARYSEEMYERKVDWIARTLDEGEVDLVGFQELFSRKSLDDVLERSSRLSGAHVFAPDLDDNSDGELFKGPFCGLVTTCEVVAKDRILKFPQEVVDKLFFVPDGEPANAQKLPIDCFQRPVLRVKLKINGRESTVFVTHLKSKVGQFLPTEQHLRKDPFTIAVASARSLVVRAAESVALRKLVLDELVGSAQPVIVIGDLNDELPAVTTQIVAGPLPFGAASPAVFDRVLYSVHDLQNREILRDVDYTHIFDSRYQVLDHIFVSQEFFRRNPDRIGHVRNTRIFNDHLVDTGLAVHAFSDLSDRSDHGVVITQIELRAQA